MRTPLFESLFQKKKKKDTGPQPFGIFQGTWNATHFRENHSDVAGMFRGISRKVHEVWASIISWPWRFWFTSPNTLKNPILQIFRSGSSHLASVGEKNMVILVVALRIGQRFPSKWPKSMAYKTGVTSN